MGAFRWRGVDGDELNGNFHLVRDGSAYRIDYQPVRWAVQEKRYIPTSLSGRWLLSGVPPVW